VQDAGGQTVGWFYFRHNEETAREAKVAHQRRGAADSGELRPAAGAAGEDRSRLKLGQASDAAGARGTTVTDR
jgi:hypothetical protein